MADAGRTISISKTTVDQAKPADDRYTAWDSKLKGFGVRVAKSGVKTYIARYRVGGGRTGVLRQQVIGRHGTLTAEEARAEAKLILAAVAKGKDPQGAKAAKRAEQTIADLCDLYLDEGCATKKASTLYVDRRRIERHIKPLIGKIRIGDLTRAHVERLMRDIGEGKTKTEASPRARGGRPAAARTVALLGSIMTFAVDRKLRPDNPVRGVKTYAVPKRERFLSAAEWAALGQALADSEAAGADPRPVNIIRLLSLTGCRKSEIAGLKWSDIESERGLLVLQDSKTGWKAVPVGAAALEVLSKIDRGDGPYVFPDPFHPEKPFGQLFWFWSGLRKRAGLEGLRIHDLRHSFASTGLAAGQGLAVLSKLLGHADIHMTQRYAHLAADPLKAAADRIASNIEGAMAGRSAEIHSIGGGSKGAA